jgi:hypothetical protein
VPAAVSQDIGFYYAFIRKIGGSRIDMILTVPAVRIPEGQIDRRMFDGRYAAEPFSATGRPGLF